jgi:DNA adenine methylase
MIYYYGGKQRIARRIVSLLPPHTVYVEPFCGGCAVLSKKGLSPVRNSVYYREVINDKNEQLVAFFRQLQNNPDLIRKLECTLYSRSECKKASEILKNSESSDEDLAWAFFVSTQQGFGGKLNSGWGTCTRGENHPCTFANKVNRLSWFQDRIKKVHIECDEALKVISRWDSPHTCFYCDPPYPGTNQGPYSGYTLQNYTDLIDVLKNIQGSFVLSCYEQGCEPKEWTQVKIKTRMAVAKMAKNRDRTESLWIVDRSKDSSSKLLPYLWSPSKGFPYKNKGLFAE